MPPPFEHNTDFKPEPLPREDTAAGRIYTGPDGGKYPSITTVLSIVGRNEIEAWRKRIGEEKADRILFQASRRGTAVHEMAEKYINNDEGFKEGRTPDLVETFNSIRSVLDENLGTVHAVEAPLYSRHLGLAGTVDCVAEYSGQLSVIDFKTSRRRKTAPMINKYFMQESGYAVMWEERTGMPITRLVTIIAVDGSPGRPQVFIEHRDNWVNSLKYFSEKWKKEQNLSTVLYK